MALPRHYITGTSSDLLDGYRAIMEMHYGHGYSFGAIAEIYGISRSNVQKICNKYRPRKGDKDITMTIMSKV